MVLICTELEVIAEISKFLYSVSPLLVILYLYVRSRVKLSHTKY
jgi:hypothetical protein